MFRRCTSAMLVAAFAAVSLLGHGGLHLLPGGHDCHGHAALSPRHDHGHGHHDHDGHDHDGHGHVGHEHGSSCCHSHADASAEPEPAAPVPLDHDEDHCLICQWHAQTPVKAVTVSLPLIEELCFEIAPPPAPVTTAFRLTTLLTRGPPLLG